MATDKSDKFKKFLKTKKAKGEKKVTKKGVSKPLEEKTLITNLVKCLSNNNYAEANKYLGEAIALKLKKRIAAANKNPLF